jgi:hypothetical protein
MVCERCGEHEALASKVIVGTVLGAFCEACARALMQELVRSAGEEELTESGLTPEQVAEGLLETMKAIRHLPPDASPEQIRRALGGDQ